MSSDESDILLTEGDGLLYDDTYKVSQVFIRCCGGPMYLRQRICELTKVPDTSPGIDEISASKDKKNAAKAHKVLIKSSRSGTVREIFVKKDQIVTVGSRVVRVSVCRHPTMLGNTCGDCGVTIEEEDEEEGGDAAGEGSGRPNQHQPQETVAMLHSMPGLKVSLEEARRLGREDKQHLLDHNKLVLLVDLDQTILHTTNDEPPSNAEDLFHFRLHQLGPVYHTRLRPYTRQFLKSASRLFQLHICTFGVREYAHAIAKHLDPNGELFGDRILSRNECLDPMSKKANLKSLFPCGDELVCIIDDRSDVWNFAPNVVQVLPYLFFEQTGDINAPPSGLPDLNKEGGEAPDSSDLLNKARRKYPNKVGRSLQEGSTKQPLNFQQPGTEATVQQQQRKMMLQQQAAFNSGKVLSCSREQRERLQKSVSSVQGSDSNSSSTAYSDIDEVGVNGEEGAVKTGTLDLVKGDKKDVKSDNDTLIKSDKDDLFKRDNDTVIKSDKDDVVKSDKDDVIKSDKDDVIKSDKDDVIKSDKDDVIKSDKDDVIKSDKDDVVKSDKDDVVKSDKDDVVKSDKDDVVKSDKDDVVKSDKDDVVKSDKDDVVKSDEDDVVMGDKDDVVMGNKDDVVKSDKDDVVKSDKDDVAKDDKDDVVKDDQDAGKIEPVTDAAKMKSEETVDSEKGLKSASDKEDVKMDTSGENSKVSVKVGCTGDTGDSAMETDKVDDVTDPRTKGVTASNKVAENKPCIETSSKDISSPDDTEHGSDEAAADVEEPAVSHATTVKESSADTKVTDASITVQAETEDKTTDKFNVDTSDTKPKEDLKGQTLTKEVTETQPCIEGSAVLSDVEKTDKFEDIQSERSVIPRQDEQLQNGTWLGEKTTEVESKIVDSDDYLLHLEDILIKLHREFYSQYRPTKSSRQMKNRPGNVGNSVYEENERVQAGLCKLPDLKEIVPELRSEVLVGCSIVFSGVVPRGTDLLNSKAYGIATSLGARVCEDLTLPPGEQRPSTAKEATSLFGQFEVPTTHVVAANLHTVKVKQARSTRAAVKSIQVVTPDWLWACWERWERVDERLYPLTAESEATLRRSAPHHYCAPPPGMFRQQSMDLFLMRDTAKKSMMEEVDEDCDSEDSAGGSDASSGKGPAVRHAITSKSTTDGRASQRTLQSNLDSDAESTYLPSDKARGTKRPLDAANPESSQTSSSGNDDVEGDSESNSKDATFKTRPSQPEKKRKKLMRKKRKKKLDRQFVRNPSRSDGVCGGDDDTDGDDSSEADELPSVRFRRGGALESGEDGSSSAASDVEALDSGEEERLLMLEQDLMES